MPVIGAVLDLKLGRRLASVRAKPTRWRRSRFAPCECSTGGDDGRVRRRDVLLFSHIALLGVALLIPSPSSSIDASDTLAPTTVGSGLSSARRRFGAVAQSAGASPRAHASTSVANSASRSTSEAGTSLRARSPPPRGATRGVVRARAPTRGGEHVQRVVARHGDGAFAPRRQRA